MKQATTWTNNHLRRLMAVVLAIALCMSVPMVALATDGKAASTGVLTQEDVGCEEFYRFLMDDYSSDGVTLTAEDILAESVKYVGVDWSGWDFTKIADDFFATYMPSIEIIVIEQTKLTSLNLQGCTNLKHVYLRNTPTLTSISLPSSVEYLDLNDTGVTKLAFLKNLNLKELTLERTNVTADEIMSNVTQNLLSNVNWLKTTLSSLAKPQLENSKTISDGGTISLTSDFATGTQVSVTEVTAGTEANAVAAISSDYILLDVDLTADGTEVPVLGDSLTIKLENPPSWVYDGSNVSSDLKLACVSGKEVTYLDAEFSMGSLVVKTNALGNSYLNGIIAIIGATSTPDTHSPFIHGYGGGKFGPKNNMTRAEAAQMLYSLTGDTNEYASSFPDVSNNAWYYPAIACMQEYEVVAGYPNGNFGPNDNITRAEFLAMLVRWTGEKLGSNTNNFPDVSDSHWAVNYINIGVAKGWICGYPNRNCYPDDNITRAEAVAVMCRMLERTNCTNSGTNPFSDVSSDYWAYAYIMEAAISHTIG